MCLPSSAAKLTYSRIAGLFFCEHYVNFGLIQILEKRERKPQKPLPDIIADFNDNLADNEKTATNILHFTEEVYRATLFSENKSPKISDKITILTALQPIIELGIEKSSSGAFFELCNKNDQVKAQLRTFQQCG